MDDKHIKKYYKVPKSDNFRGPFLFAHDSRAFIFYICIIEV